MITFAVYAAIALGSAPVEPAQAANGFLVCSAIPTRPGSNRVALLNLSYGDEARAGAMSDEYAVWLRSDATVAKDIAAAGIDPRLVLAQMKNECVWAKVQSGAEEIAIQLANRLRADNIKVLSTNWSPKADAAPAAQAPDTAPKQ